MDRLDYQTQIEIIIEDACDNLSSSEFEIFKKRVIETVENYD